MSGLPYKNVTNPSGVPNPTMKAKKVNTTNTASASLTTSTSASNITYFRRYLDWNRLTFEYHAAGSQIKTFDTAKGLNITQNITGGLDLYEIVAQIMLTTWTKLRERS